MDADSDRPDADEIEVVVCDEDDDPARNVGDPVEYDLYAGEEEE